MAAERVVLLARASGATAMLYHALAAHFDVQVVLEDPPPTMQLLRSRIRRLGLWRVLGQVLFQVCVARPLAKRSKERVQNILRSTGTSQAPIPSAITHRVPTVNGAACHTMLQRLAPRVVVINGTRILKGATLQAIGVPVLNTHVGITPRYRGVHGAYWALVNDDRAHCGVTVHLVDEGIDTGGVLHQAVIDSGPEDDFSTYPVLQIAAGCPLMVQAVREAVDDRLRVVNGTADSGRWYHPTLGEYLRHRLRKGVR
jgi:folate-dependent phosphoribosylglycinamide formyltransferase PurN